jgi:porin
LIYEGLTDVSLAYDFRPQFHWRGNFFVRAYQIHGRGLTANYMDNLNTVSGIEATATARLFELWYEQHIGDWLRIRIGQQSAGQEFLVTTAAKPFINSAFGWPTLPDTDLPSGGPSYPLATPAVRFRIDASDELKRSLPESSMAIPPDPVSESAAAGCFGDEFSHR